MQPSSSFNVTNLIGNLAALFVIVIAGAATLDYLTSLLGMRPGLTCAVLQPTTILAHTVAVGLGTIGVIVFVISNFSRPELMIGALIIGILPGVLLHYLGGPGCGL
jgi:hypothetical protein